MRDAGQSLRDAHTDPVRVPLAPGHATRDIQHPGAGVALLPVDHCTFDAQRCNVGGNPLDAGHFSFDAHMNDARVDLAPGQQDADAQLRAAGGNTLPDLTPARSPSSPIHEPPGSTTFPPTRIVAPPNLSASAGTNSDPGQRDHDTQKEVAGMDPHSALLRFQAESLDDLERLRIATSNRLRALTAEPANDDDKALGLSGTPTEAHLRAMLDALTKLEHQATLQLQRTMRTHPLGAWVKATIGIGEKQAARLLAALGDPAARPNPAKLWQYAGHGDPARSKLRKGQPVEHSPTAKMRTRLIAESCIKQANSPYRPVYDRERAKWADRDTTDLHKHNHALRVVGKAMLLDLWRAARAAA